MTRAAIALFALFLAFLPLSSVEANEEGAPLYRAEVLKVIALPTETIAGTEIQTSKEELLVRLLSGPKKGEQLSVDNDRTEVAVGETVFIREYVDEGGGSRFFLHDIDRRGAILFVVLLFVVVIVGFSGFKGVRSLLSLVGSFMVIFFLLLPLLLKGYPPIPTVSVAAAIILALVMYVTHGVTRITHASFLGTTATIIFAGILSYVVVSMANLTGFSDDNAVFLNAATGGTLDLRGLLLGGIIVGVLGLLDDIAVTQAATVAELRHANAALSNRELYSAAMRVGREHIGALVNTLALAYAGVSLPLLLLFIELDTPAWVLLNQEVFATEILRTAIGGIALVLAVPLTTYLAIYLVRSEDAGVHAHSH